ncbi:hypothetical protein HYE68_009978 [Fusarium pseudograminearum]|nr:hypothetical protein HYE68_009978 [Fusarium pseudograminearum]
MATPELAIAKATLSATLFRADPTSLSRPSVEAFFSLLTDALVRCSRPNVQKCKVWIIENVAPSTARTTALAKYYGALSKSLQDDGSRPSLKRRRLHLLYVLNDVFYHIIARNGNIEFAIPWDNVLPSLIASASAFDNCPKHKKKLEDLIRLWDEQQYINSKMVTKLEEALASGVAPQTAQEPQVSNVSLKLAKNAPFTLPSFHGDNSVPWHDLPATTWLPHLTPNSTKPMFPDEIRPIRLAPGPADKVLVNAVQDLLGEVERMFSKEQKWDDDPTNDLNELGERIILDEITGDIIGGTEVVQDHVATRVVDHEALRDLRISGQGSQETPGVEVQPVVEVGLTAATMAEVETDVILLAIAEAAVAVEAVETSMIVRDSDRTADHGPVHLRDSTTKTFKIDRIVLPRFLHSSLKPISLPFLHEGISLHYLHHQRAIMALGQYHRLLRPWHQVGSLTIRP